MSADTAIATNYIEQLTAGSGKNTYVILQRFLDEYSADGFLNHSFTITNPLLAGADPTGTTRGKGTTWRVCSRIGRLAGERGDLVAER